MFVWEIYFLARLYSKARAVLRSLCMPEKKWQRIAEYDCLWNHLPIARWKEALADFLGEYIVISTPVIDASAGGNSKTAVD